jgi:hypothetical protein
MTERALVPGSWHTQIHVTPRIWDNSILPMFLGGLEASKVARNLSTVSRCYKPEYTLSHLLTGAGALFPPF